MSWESVCFGSNTCAASLSAVADQMEKSEDFVVQKSDVLFSNTGLYLIQDFIGEGAFGKVAKSMNLMTSQEVALKILMTEDSEDAEREIKMLKAVSVLDPVKKNVAQFIEQFDYRGHTCLAFEMLDRCLFQLLIDRDWKPLSLSEIRPIAQQLLTAFDALKDIGVIHADLKPDNVMLANHQGEHFRVKLIDFGVSFTTSEVMPWEVQPLGYRAPEVSLGLPISEAIDVWGLGCVLAFLYIAQNPFSIDCEYQTMRGIAEILGQPADHLLSAGKNTHRFFELNQHSDNPKWRLKTEWEYQLDTGIVPESWEKPFKCLDDLITSYPCIPDPAELDDRRAFVSLLKCLLQTDPDKRITPEEALTHSFLTMAHLEDEMNISLYVEDKMLVCPVDDSEVLPSSFHLPLPPDGESDEGTKGEAPLATPGANGAGSATDGSPDEGPPHVPSNWEMASDSEPASPNHPSTQASSTVKKVKNSWLKRVRRFFGRAIRTLFGRKKRE